MIFVVSKQVHLGQGRHGQFLADKAATAAFYSTKSRQGLDLRGLVSHGDLVGKIDLVVDFLSSLYKNKVACKPQNSLIAPSKNLFSSTFNFNDNLVCPIK